jgi:hypothetical protein
LLGAVYYYLDIKGLRTTPFHPECNGQSERTVQVTKLMIRAHIDENQSNWDLILNKIEFAYNTSVHETTKTHHSNYNLVANRQHQSIFYYQTPNNIKVNQY